MFIVLFLLSILFLFLVKYSRYKAINGFPVYPGALPLIGNAHLLIGDSVYLYKIIQKASVKLLENKGHMALSFGPLKCVYVIADPDDSATTINACLDKHYVYSFTKSWMGEGLVTANAKTWINNRKFLHPMFSLLQVRRFLPIFNKHARRLVEIFAEQEGKGAFNPEPDIMVTSLESICQTALGSDVSEHLTTNKQYMEAIDSLVLVFIARFKQFWLHINSVYRWSSMKRKQDKYIKLINNTSNEYINKRKLNLESGTRNTIEDIQPFLESILKASQTKGFTDEKVLHEINTLIVAGYDTTASAVLYCLMLLGHHQDVQAKLVEELKEVFGDTDRDVDKDDIVKLVYLEAVIKESLRLFPVIPIVARTTRVEIKLKKHIIPAGSDIAVSLYSINRHPMWGPDVEQFRPERWLDGTAPSDPNLYAAFSFGKRSCIGKTYNTLSLKTTLSHVIRRFHVSSDTSKLVLKMEVILKAASGQHIILEPRI